MKMKPVALIFLLLSLNLNSLFAQTILVEAESFQNKGGWSVDQQFMREMGSPYLLAHGLGTPVANATTTLTIPTTGTYRVWVRTKDWVAQWNASGAPGKFQIILNDQKLDTIFGTKNAFWSWQDGGVINLSKTDLQIQLSDLTGYEGRCDAILLTKDTKLIPPSESSALEAWRKNLLGNTVIRNAGQFDFVVVGGGMAGTAAAISAARLGLTVALIQDRPVVGGNNSTEVRVGLGGALQVSPYVNLGKIIQELIVPVNPAYPLGNGNDSVYNDQIRMNILKAEKNITLFMNYRADSVTTNNQSLQSVLAQNTLSAERIEVFGTYFSDCTGDGTIGYLAGADYEINLAKHMGNTNLWNLKEYNTPQTFPRCPWAINLTDKPFPGRPGIKGPSSTSGLVALGSWFWESGFSHNPITEVEYIRDYNLRAMYGAWDCVKNVDGLYANYKLNWAAYITGKRESRRLLGDVLLTKEDLIGNVRFPDGFVGIGWNMDVHIPHASFQSTFEGEEFISLDVQTPFKRPFYIPYRCMYSRNINNLFMAGRDISVTQDALGTVRVMKTTGMMGEMVGLAAGLCKKLNTLPRSLYTTYLNELKQYVYAGVPAFGDTLTLKTYLLPDSKNPQIVVDNTDPECTFDKVWLTSVYTGGYIGANYMQDGSAAADPTKWAQWTPTIPKSGKYRVFMNWTEGGNRPADAPVEIQHADSISYTTVNQTTSGGIWNYIGTYRFDAGNQGYVKLSASSVGSTIADAVLFEDISLMNTLKETSGMESDITIYGNSSNSRVVLDLAKNAKVSLSIYTLYGTEVKSILQNQSLSANRYFFDLPCTKLLKGVYLIKLLVNGKMTSCRKMVI